jgi:hypothetical protein
MLKYVPACNTSVYKQVVPHYFYKLFKTFENIKTNKNDVKESFQNII